MMSRNKIFGHAEISLNLKRTFNCQWGIALRNGYTQLGGQLITTPPTVKAGTSLRGYYTTESSQRNICTSGVNETQIIALGAKEPQEIDHMFFNCSCHSHLEAFSQDNPPTTRSLPTAEKTCTVRLFHPRYHSPTTRKLPAGIGQDHHL
jgi:hypothetical protein